jgi:hypothetical protein
LEIRKKFCTRYQKNVRQFFCEAGRSFAVAGGEAEQSGYLFSAVFEKISSNGFVNILQDFTFW